MTYPLNYTNEDKQVIVEIENDLIADYYFDYPAKVLLEALMHGVCETAVLCGLTQDQFIERCAEKFSKLERKAEAAWRRR